MRVIDKGNSSENIRKVYYIHVAWRGGVETSTYAINIRNTPERHQKESERNNTPAAQ